MSEPAIPKITELIETPDTLEIVRDQIAAILSLELQNQYALAQEHGIPRTQDYNIKIFVENTRPYDGAGEDKINLINILVPKVTVPAINPRIGNQKEKAIFFIDCAADGNNTGNFRDDKSAAFRAWKIMRLVRRILMSEQYTYLGLRGTVTSRAFMQMESGSPNIQAALALTVIRATLEVEFVEGYIENPSVPFEGLKFDVIPKTGEVIAKISIKDRVMGLTNNSHSGCGCRSRAAPKRGAWIETQEEQNVTGIGNK